MLFGKLQPNAGCYAGPTLAARPPSFEEGCIKRSTERCAEAARVYVLQCAVGSLQRLVTAGAAAARLCSYKGLLRTASKLCRKDSAEAPACHRVAAVSAAHATQSRSPTLKSAVGTQTEDESCRLTGLCNKALPSTAPCSHLVNSPTAEGHPAQSPEPGKALPESRKVSRSRATPSFVRQEKCGSRVPSEAVGCQKHEGAKHSSDLKKNLSRAEREATVRSTPQDACRAAATSIPEEKLRWIASYEYLSEKQKDLSKELRSILSNARLPRCQSKTVRSSCVSPQLEYEKAFRGLGAHLQTIRASVCMMRTLASDKTADRTTAMMCNARLIAKLRDDLNCNALYLERLQAQLTMNSSTPHYSCFNQAS